jgi:hypothetical protein
MNEKEKLSNEHFHDEAKSCYLTNKRVVGSKAGSILYCRLCETHNVLVCGCGWEFGWHYGTNSNLFDLNPTNTGRPRSRREKVLL